MQPSELVAVVALVAFLWVCYLMARRGDGKPGPRAVLVHRTYESSHTVVREVQPVPPPPPPRLLVLVVREGREEEDLRRQAAALPPHAEVIDAEFWVRGPAPGDKLLPDNRPLRLRAAKDKP